MKKSVKTIAALVMTACLAISATTISVSADFSKDKNGNTVYTDESGEKATGLKKIEGTYYYFDKNGIMQTGTKIINNKNIYTFGKDGKFKKKADGWVEFTKGTYYCIKGKIQKGIVTITDEYGNKGQYYFDENGRLVTGKNVEYKLLTLYIGSDGEIYSIVDNTDEKRSELRDLKDYKKEIDDYIKKCDNVLKELEDSKTELRRTVLDYQLKQDKASSGGRTRMTYGSDGSVSYKSEPSATNYQKYIDAYQEKLDDCVKEIDEVKKYKKDANKILRETEKQIKELEVLFNE